ncbi:MAG: HAD-IA family hydrolase [Nitrospirae bacterium]|nr:HAD-IA family hydrolase [Nitrospirota bacterium]MBI5694249.1 HAD-IA family hydrolase [Nitrospirota bacterium]
MDNNGSQGARIRAVFFDLGKVILSFSHDDIVGRLLSATPPADRRPDELFRFLFDSRDGLCNLYDEGAVSSEEFFGRIDGRFGLGVGFGEFADLWNGIFTEDAAVTEIVRAVRADRPAYLLSNVNELHWEYIQGRYGVLSELDGLALSYRMETKKPKPEIFEAALEMAGVKGHEAVFIDDLEENTRAAAEFGITGITFTGHDDLARTLRGMGLLR